MSQQNFIYKNRQLAGFGSLQLLKSHWLESQEFDQSCPKGGREGRQGRVLVLLHGEHSMEWCSICDCSGFLSAWRLGAGIQGCVQILGMERRKKEGRRRGREGWWEGGRGRERERERRRRGRGGERPRIYHHLLWSSLEYHVVWCCLILFAEAESISKSNPGSIRGETDPAPCCGGESFKKDTWNWKYGSNHLGEIQFCMVSFNTPTNLHEI